MMLTLGRYAGSHTRPSLPIQVPFWVEAAKRRRTISSKSSHVGLVRSWRRGERVERRNTHWGVVAVESGHGNDTERERETRD